MTNETLESSKSDHMNYAIGARLKSAREALGFNQKDVASQLRLHENVITMLENDSYPDDLPMIFVRGYIRSYAKFVELPDYVIKEILNPVQPPVMQQTTEMETKLKSMFEPTIEHSMRHSEPTLSARSKKLIMRTFTLAIILTLGGLLLGWWYNHSTMTARSADHLTSSIPFDMGAPPAAQESASQTTIQAPVQTGNPSTGSIQIPLAPQVSNALSNSATKPVATDNTPTNHLGEPINEADELVTITKVSVSSKAMDKATTENQVNNDETIEE
jgi:cytoskeleton protein RodZ